MQPSEILAPALPWAAPFFGVLLSIAVVPAVAPRFWHHRVSWISAFWVFALLLPWSGGFGLGAATALAWHALLVEYLPFIALLLALYVAGGGIMVSGGLPGTPSGNTTLLGIGMLLAGVMGTTGAAMVLIHPLLRANAHRRRKMHLALFFILLVANAGGALSPLGDPPLYLGYLRGVPFFWPLIHIGPLLVVLAFVLLTAFWAVDKVLAAREPAPEPAQRLHIRGWRNAALILLIGAILFGLDVVNFGSIGIGGAKVPLDRLISSGAFLLIAAVSTLWTPRSIRQWNEFAWHPIIEVAVLFLAIFITIEPVLKMLLAGPHGPLAPLLQLTIDARGHPRPVEYFWLSGTLSAFLDNAPTYLVFFDLAHLQPPNLSGEQIVTLEALSAGAVFFGGLTYIGNAPNMMVRGIAAHRGVHMPGFFTFTLMAAGTLLPVFALLTVLFFR